MTTPSTTPRRTTVKRATVANARTTSMHLNGRRTVTATSYDMEDPQLSFMTADCHGIASIDIFIGDFGSHVHLRGEDRRIDLQVELFTGSSGNDDTTRGLQVITMLRDACDAALAAKQSMVLA